MGKTWVTAELLQLSGGYWSACALHAAVKLDIFSGLAEKPVSAIEVAKKLKGDKRGVAMLLDALAAMELVTKEGENYVITPFSAEFLVPSSPAYLGHIILHHHHLMESWVHLDEAVKAGKPVRERVSHADDEVARESFEMGMFNLAMQLAPKIVPSIDLKGRKRLIDLGGGPGTYAIHFCQQNPALSAVVYDLPTTRPFAEKTIARFNLSDRIRFAAGDFINDRIEGGFDVAWLSHILHGEGPTGCAVLLKRAAEALEPGGLLLVQEFVLDDSRDKPLFPALFSLNMLLGTPEGQSYSEGEIATLLKQAGLHDVRRLPFDLPNGAGVIAAIK